MIQIALNQQQFQLGDPVRGTATWTPESGEAPRAFFVTVGWRTEGRGTDHREILWQQRVPPTGMPIQIPFELLLPLDGPTTYNGHMIRIIWEVTAGLDVPLRRDPGEIAVLSVAPRRLPEQSAF